MTFLLENPKDFYENENTNQDMMQKIRQKGHGGGRQEKEKGNEV